MSDCGSALLEVAEIGIRRVAPGWRDFCPAPELRVVALGGGTGLPATLVGLKQMLFPPGSRSTASSRDRLTAIVTVGDDGGSSGRLRRSYGVLPPGDIRNCLLALSDGDPAIRSLFEFRFDGDGGVAGHSLGNLILTAFSMMRGGLCSALDQVSEILDVCGRVLPSSTEQVALRAQFADGTIVDGESRIAQVRRPIRRVSILPHEARAHPWALHAIARAGLIVIGPGSLYTSLIPILLIKDLAASIRCSRARVVLVANLMSEPGETDDYTVADLVEAIKEHAPDVPIHDVLVNHRPVPERSVRQYAAEGAAPIRTDVERLRSLGCRTVSRDLLVSGRKLRHDPARLGEALIELTVPARQRVAHA